MLNPEDEQQILSDEAKLNREMEAIKADNLSNKSLEKKLSNLALL